VTVVDRHEELFVLYVRWAVFQELASTESSDPYARRALYARPIAGTATSLALSTLERSIQRLYLQSLDKAQNVESKSASMTWRIDKWDRA
jgi:hypothetical protein